MTIRIAICDDELCICSQIENILIDILQHIAVKFEIEVYCSGESLCKELEEQDFDIVFLDIELPKLSGIEVSHYIRNHLKNEIMQIVYISADKGYAMKLFEFRPINFLVKPLDKEKVAKVIDKYFAITGQNIYMFEYKRRTEYYKIPMSKILYFERKNRKVKIYTTDGGYDEFYESMENVYVTVKNHDFLFIHKSIIVNYQFIKRMAYNEVVMIDGTILPISQSRRKAIKSMYMKIRKGET